MARMLIAAALLGPLLDRPAAAQSRPVLVFAATSLKNALDEIAGQWTKATGKQIRISYAASSALAKQIEGAAPADIFLPADRDWMDYVAQRKLIKPESRANLLGNRIVLIAAKDSKAAAKIEPGFPLRTLLGDGRLAIANVDAVPAGKYGKASLEALGVWASVQDRIAQSENVRAALLLVSRGEAPLGIVYQTDATADPNVRIVGAFPENTHPAIVYPIALVASSANPDATAFVAWLASPAARASFEKQGFTVLK